MIRLEESGHDDGGRIGCGHDEKNDRWRMFNRDLGEVIFRSPEPPGGFNMQFWISFGNFVWVIFGT